MTVYSDIRTSFRPHPITGDIELVTDADSVRQALMNIVRTVRGERYGLPNFGAGIHRELFEQSDAILEDNIESALRRSIEELEPRVVLLNCTAKASEHTVTVTLTFMILNLQSTPETLQVVLERIR